MSTNSALVSLYRKDDEIHRITNILLDHGWVGNLSLGHYKTELECKCGTKFIHDGHATDEPRVPEILALHMAMLIKGDNK